MNARAIALAHWSTAAGAGLGAIAGAAYAFFIGCNTGTCPLTSNIWTAALFFGFTGGVVGIPGPRAKSRPGAAGPRSGGTPS